MYMKISVQRCFVCLFSLIVEGHGPKGALSHIGSFSGPKGKNVTILNSELWKLSQHDCSLSSVVDYPGKSIFSS